MLRPHPSVLRRLVDEYERLPASGVPEAPSGRISDLAYTLCVTTGTRDVRHALETAHRWLAATESATESATPGPAAG